LLKLGIEISETSVAKYMVWHRKPSPQTWRTFLDNHVQNLVSRECIQISVVGTRRKKAAFKNSSWMDDERGGAGRGAVQSE
jgi:hypothetical protein